MTVNDGEHYDYHSSGRRTVIKKVLQMPEYDDHDGNDDEIRLLSKAVRLSFHSPKITPRGRSFSKHKPEEGRRAMM